MPKVAFITGGNGISGGAIAEYLVAQTTSEQWSKIIVTSRSPFKTNLKDPRVSFIALDFSHPVDTLVADMKQLCSDTTHAFFSSYIHKDDFAELNSANQGLFENFLNALTEVAPSLENVTLQTGGKHYNLHLYPIPTPVREEDPPHESPMANFYHSQQGFLIRKQKGSRWSWNVIRPQAIIGSTHSPNGMNEALTIAMYFTICSYLGQEAPMPTNAVYWNGTDDTSSAALIADLSVFAATNPRCANEEFNVVNGDVFTWRYMWPRLAAYYGARASPSSQKFTGPSADTAEGDRPAQNFSLADWAKDKRAIWDEICDARATPGAKATFDYGTWAFQDWVFGRTWTATLSINKARRFGWNGHVDSYKCFTDTFDKFVAMGIMPPAAKVTAKHAVNGW